MKTALTLFLIAAPLFATGNGAMTDDERAFLVQQLEESKKNLLDSISGLSAAQWKFKPAPDVWSVAECAEHIILSEDLLSGFAQKALQNPAVPRLGSATPEADRKLVERVEDRSKKATAPAPLVPSGHFSTPEDAVRAFTEKRDRNIAYAKSTDDALRVHVTQSPAGSMDAYQFLLLMAAHSARHTAQIREVESNPNYPKAAAKTELRHNVSGEYGDSSQFRLVR